MKSNVRGQSQLLIPILVILTSAIVFAANATLNITNSTPNGRFLNIQQTEERNFSIDAWANTSLTLEFNQTTAKALLLLDNGTVLDGQEIKFYLNDSFIGSNLTGIEGFAEINLNASNESLNAVFEGNSSLFLNPSEAVLNLIETENNTQNITETNVTENTTEENETVSKPLILNFGLSKNSIYENESLMLYASVENASSVIFEINSINYSAVFDGDRKSVV